MFASPSIKSRLVASLLAFSFASANGAGLESLSVRKVFDLTTLGAAVAVAWSADGSALAAVSNYGDDFTVWDRAGHRVNQIQRGGGGPTLEGSLAFVHGSTQLVFPPPETPKRNTAFAVWNISTGQIAQTVYGPEPEDGSALFGNAHFMASPDQSLLATAANGHIVIFESASWRVLHTATIQQGTSSLCVFGNGQFIAVGSIISGEITVLNAKTGAVIQTIQGYEQSKYGDVTLGAIAGDPAGDLIMVGISSSTINGGVYYGTAGQRAWDVATGTTDAIRMFRAKDGVRIAKFSAAKGPIRQATWDPKGRFVAFVDNHRGLFFWAPWAEPGYKRIGLPSKSMALAISPGGDLIAVTTDKGARVYSIQ